MRRSRFFSPRVLAAFLLTRDSKSSGLRLRHGHTYIKRNRTGKRLCCHSIFFFFYNVPFQRFTFVISMSLSVWLLNNLGEVTRSLFVLMSHSRIRLFDDVTVTFNFFFPNDAREYLWRLQRVTWLKLSRNDRMDALRTLVHLINSSSAYQRLLSLFPEHV